MKLSNIVRIAGLCLALSISAVSTFAAPPAPQPCSCEYCPTVPSNRACTNDGTTMTCGYFLAVTLCPAS